MSFPWAVNINRTTFRRCERDLRVRAWRKHRLYTVLALTIGVAALGTRAPQAEAAAPRAGMPRSHLPLWIPGTGFIGAGGARVPIDSTALPRWSANFGQHLRPTINGNAMTIEQEAMNAVLNWESFNIGGDASVRFNQRSAEAVAINKIGGRAPSYIFGRLEANGQIYLVNGNGIVFGQGARVDVHSLIASALEFDPGVYQSGLLNATVNRPTLSWQGTDFANTLVQVEPGAELKAKLGGRIMLVAPRVINEGSLSAPEGQVVLAAGAHVYLSASTEPNLRGLLVDVGSTSAVSGGGGVLNTGTISVPRGNATLVGYAVNQSGRISATTSVRLNGSIHLLARERGTNDGGVPRGGELTLGENSVTEIHPERQLELHPEPDKPPPTITGDQTFNVSNVEGIGRSIHVASGAAIVAPRGNVSLRATEDGATISGEITVPIAPVDATGIFLDNGSLIDVAGIHDVTLAMERNTLEVELRGDELKDSPLQRYSFMRGKKIYIDLTQVAKDKGIPLADISGYLRQIGLTVGELSTLGGTVTLQSRGNLVMRENATIDISGGSVNYTDGFVRSTQLISRGKIYDIAQATPDRIYDGFVGDSKFYPKWGQEREFRMAIPQARFVRGFTEGKDAGTVKFQAPGLVLEGQVRAQTLPGIHQIAANNAPMGGALVIGDSESYSAPAVSFAALTQGVSQHLEYAQMLATGLPDAARAKTAVAPRLLADGVSRVSAFSHDRITIERDATVTLPARGFLKLTGRQIDVQGAIVISGGTVSLKTDKDAGSIAFTAADRDIKVSGNILTNGQWVNDLPTTNPRPGTVAPTIDGGSIALDSIADLTIAEESLLDVSGGGWLQANRKVKAGKGGGIKLSVGRYSQLGGGSRDAALPQTSVLKLGGELRGYGLSDGGTLTLDASRARIGGEADDRRPEELFLPGTFFQRGGFKNYELSGYDSVTVAGDVPVQAQNLVLNPNFAAQVTGTSIDAFGTPTLLPPEQRAPGSIGFTAKNKSGGEVLIAPGARVSVDAGGAIKLASDYQLTVHGTLSAPAGGIALAIPEAGEQDSYLPTQSIWLGADSRLLATGVAIPQENDRGLALGEVRAAGTVKIDAKRGYIVTQAGSLIDVSGASANLDVRERVNGQTGYTAKTVNGNAGTIDLTATEGMLLDGAMAAGARGDAAGGTLSITVPNKVNVPPDYYNFYGQPLDRQRLIVTQQAVPVARDLQVGQAISGQHRGIARVAADTIARSGFDNALLKSYDRIEFDGPVSLALPRSLSLDAPVIAANNNTELRAAYIALGNTDGSPQRAATLAPLAGTATLNANARLLDISGNIALEGFKQINLRSEEDIRLRGIFTPPPGLGEAPRPPVGKLVTDADVKLTARQIYPTTFSDYTISLQHNPSGTVTIAGIGTPSDARPVLSAAGKLRIEAPNIEQNGVLKAPFGKIDLNASERLSLGDDSLTSVSADGRQIPFGRIELSGRGYVYPLSDTLNAVVETTPERQITLNGKHVAMADNAQVDLSGGGDLYAYEFTPGPGGSRDVLNAVNAKDSFAIMPGHGGEFAPYDPHYNNDASAALAPGKWREGDRVYLAGGPGLAAGFYTLMPARYALLPGAYLVKPQAGTTDFIPSGPAMRPDGSQYIAGYRAAQRYDDSWTRDARTSAFDVRPLSTIRNQAEYQDTLASKFFAANSAAQRPGDAGRLSISATESLAPNGKLITKFIEGYRGAEVDIGASKLAVVSAATRGTHAGYLEIEADTLNRLRANSLLLGGVRHGDGDGVRIDVGSSDVIIDTSGDVLTGPEVIVAASDNLIVKAGSTVAGTGRFAGRPTDIKIGRTASANQTAVDGSGALLRAAAGAQVNVTRENFSDTRGILDVEAGATLRAANALTLDATADTRSAATIDLGPGAALAIGAKRIGVGEIDGVTAGFVFSNAQLAALGRPSELMLKSYSTFDLYGNAVVGNDSLDKLTISAAGIGGYGAVGTRAQIVARTVQLDNTNGVAFSYAPATNTGVIPVASNGVLRVDAQQVILSATGKQTETGGPSFDMRGFSQVDVIAQKEIVADGSGRFNVVGDWRLTGARITATTGAEQSIDATGALNIASGAASAALAPATGIGAVVNFSGQTISHAGRIELPSGNVTLAAQGDLDIAADGVINAAGVVRSFGDVGATVDAGSVALISETGDVNIGTGALVDVSGALGGDAGLLRIGATRGTARIDGVVKGGTQATAQNPAPKSGRFVLDVNSLPNFDALAGKVNGPGDDTGGGFFAQQYYRVRNSTTPATVAVNRNVKARDFKLVNDNGAIEVASTIDASGDKGGRIQLLAQGDVALNAGGVLDAHATGAGRRGGKVLLASRDGYVRTASGSIDVSAGTGGVGGNVHLRARVNGNDVNVGTLAGTTVAGASDFTVEAYRRYDGTGVNAVLATALADANTFMASNAASIGTRLARPDAKLRAGVEIVSAGDLTVSSDIDFTQNPGGNAGVLTLRAADDLAINGSLSDGFTTATTAGTIDNLAGESWSYRLVGGADSASADMLAVAPLGNLAVNEGDVALAANKLIRTGTGDIDIAAGRSVLFGDDRSVIYTAGKRTAPGTAIFPTGGGDITLAAQQHIKGVASNQLVNQWLLRQGTLSPNGTVNTPVAWRPLFDQFRQGVGALGGGDIEVNAGQDIENLSVVIPTNGRMTGARGTLPSLDNLTVRGEGDMTIRADGDIKSGLFYVGKGIGEIDAQGSIVAGRKASTEANAADIHTILALGDGQFDISARRNLQIETVLNPTLINQIPTTAPSSYSYFSTYGDSSSVRLAAKIGEVELFNNTTAGALANPAVSDALFIGGRWRNAFSMAIYPASLSATAFSGGIKSHQPFYMAPAAYGGLQLLAATSVDINSVRMSDTAAQLPTIRNPDSASSARIDFFTSGVGSNLLHHSAPLLHGNDAQPVRVVALDGDIIGEFNLPKAAVFFAGRDIKDLKLNVQNLRDTDVTRVTAGRDVSFPAKRDSTRGTFESNESHITIAGPGRLEVVAGRDVDLGNSKGILSVGNAFNPYLPDGGSAVSVLAGVGSAHDYSEFAAQYFGAELQHYMLTLDPAIAPDRALTAYRQLPRAQRDAFVRQVGTATLHDRFYTELKLSGREAANREGPRYKNYTRGYDAIAALFPSLATTEVGDARRGDINLFFSQIKTTQGGDIELMAPYGAINAGLANPGGLTKFASELGIVTARGGSIDAFVRDDFLVNQSRVFTLQGGGILIWSSEGNIDAGKGAKTASATQPPTIKTDNFGNVTVDLSQSVAGSGIGVLLAKEGIVPGATDLIAPRGEINAGDAGIRAAGDLTLAAQVVQGADNIKVGGTSSGVPVSDAGLAAGLTGVSSIGNAASATDEATKAMSQATKPSHEYIGVDVIGFGD